MKQLNKHISILKFTYCITTTVSIMLLLALLSTFIYEISRIIIPYEYPEIELTEEQEKKRDEDVRFQRMTDLVKTDGSKYYMEKVNTSPYKVYNENREFVYNIPHQYNGDYIIKLAYSRDDSYTKLIDTIDPDRQLEFKVSVADNWDEVKERWRYHPTKQLFEGFDHEGQRIGYFDRQGYHKNLPQATKPFETPLYVKPQWVGLGPNIEILYASKKNFHLINFSTRSINTLVTVSENDKIISLIKDPKDHVVLNPDEMFQTTRNPFEDTNYLPVIGVKSIHCHYIILRDNLRVIKIEDPYPLSLTVGQCNKVFYAQQSYLKDFPYEDKQGNVDIEVLTQWYEDYKNKPTITITKLFQVSMDGQLTLIRESETVRQPRYRNPFVSDWTRTYRHLGLFFPYILYDTGKLFVLFEQRVPWMGISLHEPSILVTSLLLTLWTGLLIRKRNQRWKNYAIWLPFVFLFNLTGLLTYLALNHEQTIQCHACNKKRILSQPSCNHCQAAFEKPKIRKTDLVMSS